MTSRFYRFPPKTFYNNVPAFKKIGANPASFSFIFGLFKKTIQFFTTNQCKKMSCPSSKRYWNLNPWPSERESPPITTRPGLPPMPQPLKMLIQRNLTITFKEWWAPRLGSVTKKIIWFRGSCLHVVAVNDDWCSKKSNRCLFLSFKFKKLFDIDWEISVSIGFCYFLHKYFSNQVCVPSFVRRQISWRILQTNFCHLCWFNVPVVLKNYPFSIHCWDSNLRPFEQKSPTIDH